MPLLTRKDEAFFIEITRRVDDSLPIKKVKYYKE